MINIIRIVPKFKIGGVEKGLKKEIEIVNNRNDINYHVFFIEKNELKISSSKNVNIINLNSEFYSVYKNSSFIKDYIRLNKLENVFILSSLWKSHLISLFLCSYKRISFFHSSSYSHIIDLLVSKLAARASDLLLYDCLTTKNKYSYLKKSGLVIPFVFKGNNVYLNSKWNNNDISLVFVGRLNKVKGVRRSLIIIKELVKLGANPKFSIYGPDEGELKDIINDINKLAISDYVDIKGTIPEHEVEFVLRSHQFYLQTSYREGMSSIVIEAQQSGVIPVVTPVGEIASYCKHNENALLVNDFDHKCINDIACKIIEIKSNDELRKCFINKLSCGLENFDFFNDGIDDLYSQLKSNRI